MTQWWWSLMNAEYIYSSLCPSCPNFPTWYAPFSLPHTAHLLARTELSPFSFSNEPQALGKTPVSLPETQLQLHQICSRPFYMKRSSMLLFTAVESQLSERYAGSQLSHTARDTLLRVRTDGVCKVYRQNYPGNFLQEKTGKSRQKEKCNRTCNKLS